jgi:hypothetical protein
MKIRINFRGQKQQEPGDRIPVDGEKTEDKARSSSVSDKKRKIKARRGLRPHGLLRRIGRAKSREPRHTSGEDTRRADCSNEMTTRNASAVREIGPNEAAQGHASHRPDTRKRSALGNGLAARCERHRGILCQRRGKRSEAAHLLPCHGATPEMKNRRRAEKNQTENRRRLC